MKQFKENAKNKEVNYTLPDGNQIRLGSQMIEAPELFFDTKQN